MVVSILLYKIFTQSTDFFFLFLFAVFFLVSLAPERDRERERFWLSVGTRISTTVN